MQPIRQEILALRVELVFRLPEPDDVVVHLAIAWDFDQRHGALTPIAGRLDPDSGPLFVDRFEILVVGQAALPLNQTEAPRADVLKRADLQRFRILEGTPHALT